MATTISGSLYGEGALTKFNDALNWQPPPEPLIYQAWIRPPENIAQAQGYLPEMIENAIEQNKSITAHEGSTLLITTHERRGNITVNGELIEPTDEDRSVSKTDSSPKNEIYHYEISFDGNSETMNISIENYRLNISINNDNPPSVRIDNVITDKENPSFIELEYRMDDDYGIDNAELETGIRTEDGKFRSSRLPSAQLPTISAPIKIPHKAPA